MHFTQEQSPVILQQVCRLQRQIKQQLPEVIIDTTASYASLLIHFDVFKISHRQLIQHITLIASSEADKTSLKSPDVGNVSVQKQVTLAVYYGEEVALDLDKIANHAKLTPKQVIEIHQQQTYLVYAIGFAPGFAYLGTVDERIAIPRMATPRAKVPKGSVAIAEQQTAVYPSESPGGWYIIGRCPELLFDPHSDKPMPFAVGDQVKFQNIERRQFLDMGGIL